MFSYRFNTLPGVDGVMVQGRSSGSLQLFGLPSFPVALSKSRVAGYSCGHSTGISPVSLLSPEWAHKYEAKLEKKSPCSIVGRFQRQRIDSG